jgi:hypothetical protein
MKTGVKVLFAAFYSSIETVFLHKSGEVDRCKTLLIEHRL